LKFSDGSRFFVIGARVAAIAGASGERGKNDGRRGAGHLFLIVSNPTARRSTPPFITS
jgi:hypothetical protein